MPSATHFFHCIVVMWRVGDMMTPLWILLDEVLSILETVFGFVLAV